jgi:F-box protein 42
MCRVGLQPPKFFNELHTYTLASSRWELVVTVTSPPPMAGQGATVIGDQMIIYGGCVGQNLGLVIISPRSSDINCISKSAICFRNIAWPLSCYRLNEIWVLDLRCMDWTRVDVCDSISPSPRYGHCQVAIDDEHLLIVGGCGGPNKVIVNNSNNRYKKY